MKSLSVTIQMKAIKQNFPVALFFYAVKMINNDKAKFFTFTSLVLFEGFFLPDSLYRGLGDGFFLVVQSLDRRYPFWYCDPWLGILSIV